MPRTKPPMTEHKDGTITLLSAHCENCMAEGVCRLKNSKYLCFKCAHPNASLDDIAYRNEWDADYLRRYVPIEKDPVTNWGLRLKEYLKAKESKKMGSVILFKNGDELGIQTDCSSEADFVDRFSWAISDMIEQKKNEGEDVWRFSLSVWLPQFVEMCCAYRGYKADQVKKVAVLSVGNTAAEDVVYSALPAKNDGPTVIQNFAKRFTNGEAQ